MRKDRLYFFTFLSIAIIFIIIAGVAAQYFVKASANQMLVAQLESGRREAKGIAGLASYQLESGLDKQTVVQNIQKSIQSTNLPSVFVSMFDWSGKEVCHPDITRVGQKMAPNESIVSTVDGEITSEDFYALLKDYGQSDNVDNNGSGEMDTEVIFLHPVANSDWIVGVHANLKLISDQINNLRNRFFIILTIMGFVIILSSVITVRLIGSFYERKLESEKKVLEEEVINLAKLNKALDRYQQKVSEVKPKQEAISESKKTEETKKRILTYSRHELLPVNIEEIAYIYVENTITYVIDIEGKRSTVNDSLDNLYSDLDSDFFYRANRQFIIAISSIEKIIRYGKNNLKIVMAPDCDIDIIIGKNKASEFKKWLNK